MVTFEFKSTLTDIKQQLDCRTIAEQVLGRPTSRSAKWYMFHAPDREDIHPSFGVTVNGYIDFTTGEHGDVFDLLRLLYRLTTFNEAYRLAADLVGGIAPFAAPRSVSVVAKSDEPPSAGWQQAAMEVVAYAERYLWSVQPDAQAARRYLTQQRGLTEATIRKFHLGFNPHWQPTNWRDPDTDKYIRLGPGIIIPCFAHDSLWYVKVRCIVGDLATALKRRLEQFGDQVSPKYISLKGGTSTALFNADSLTNGKPALLVEGEFDAMLTDQLCATLVTPVTVGSASNTLSKRSQQALAVAPTFLIAFDNDKAGQNGVNRLKSSLPFCAVSVPQGKDITEYVQTYHGDLATFVAHTLAKATNMDDKPIPEPSGFDLPDTYRAALNAYCYPAIAPTLEVWNEAIRARLLAPDQAITINELTAAAKTLGRDTAYATIKKAIQEGNDLFWRISQTDESPIKEKPVASSISETHHNSAGRKAVHYVLLTAEEQQANLLLQAAKRILEKHFPANTAVIAPIQAEFLTALITDVEEATALSTTFTSQYSDLINSQPDLPRKLSQARKEYERLMRDLKKRTSTPFPTDWTYRNTTEYTAIFARALIELAPDVQRSRRELAHSFGTGERNIDNVLARAGIVNQPQGTEQPVKTIQDFDQLDQAYNPQLKGYPVKIISIRRGKSRACPVQPESRVFIERELASGATVTVFYQQASRQVIATPDQPPPRPRQVRKIDEAVSDVEKLLKKSPPSPSKPRYFGAGYDPAWVAAWAIKLLERATVWRQWEDQLVNTTTGELLPADPKVVLGILLAPHANLSAEEFAALPGLVARDSVLKELLLSGGRLESVADSPFPSPAWGKGAGG